MPDLLIIDDNSSIRDLVKDFFTPRGFKVFTAGNGEEGLKIVEAEPIDLIILDINMPVMDGTAFLKHIRELPHLDFIPVIMLTASRDVSSEIENLKIGADDYVTKPVSLSLLEARVESLLRRTEVRTKTKRDHYNLLRYLSIHYKRKGYAIYSRMLPGYENSPAGWNGVVPDIILDNKGKYTLIFLETIQSLRDPKTIQKWKSAKGNYPSHTHEMIVRNKESYALARDLIKAHKVDISVKFMKRKES